MVLALLTVGATLATVFAFGWGVQSPYSPMAAIRNTVNPPQVYAPQVLAPITQTNTQTPTLYTPAYPSQGYGGWGGCWGRGASGIFGNPATGTATTPLTITQAAEVAKTYVASLNNPDLTVKEIEEYTNNFYVPVTQVSNRQRSIRATNQQIQWNSNPRTWTKHDVEHPIHLRNRLLQLAKRNNHSNTDRNR